VLRQWLREGVLDKENMGIISDRTYPSAIDLLLLEGAVPFINPLVLGIVSDAEGEWLREMVGGSARLD
jgi:hypothetical protein